MKAPEPKPRLRGFRFSVLLDVYKRQGGDAGEASGDDEEVVDAEIVEDEDDS